MKRRGTRAARVWNGWNADVANSRGISDHRAKTCERGFMAKGTVEQSKKTVDLKEHA
jgi:hypothetical protein